MLTHNTPVEDHREQWGLLVKREDLSCPPPGPPFSKTRGVWAHVQSRPEPVIGVLDTYHSQAGHAVAQACRLLGKQCINFFPRYKADDISEFRPQQRHAAALGARLVALPAGRSCILYHQAKKWLAEQGGSTYMMPNALKLPEMVAETAAEVHLTLSTQHGFPADGPVLIPISSGTIAAGVIEGFRSYGLNPHFILHMGYDRSQEAVRRYLADHLSKPFGAYDIELVSEGYSYKDTARPGPTPQWPCNAYYDLKAFRWWCAVGRAKHGQALLWNVG